MDKKIRETTWTISGSGLIGSYPKRRIPAKKTIEIPKEEPVIPAMPKYVFEPLRAGKASFQRPVYDAPGCVIRSPLDEEILLRG